MIVDMIRPGYIRTYTGIHFNPLDPDPELIDPVDIAHSLSLVNRFTGHTNFPLSVAQHSCLVSDYVSVENKLWGLLHDASEAYLSDLARPVKIQDEMCFYREAEDKLMEAICERFNLDLPIPEEVKEADDILLHTEIRDFFHISPNGHRVLKNVLESWGWRESKLQFVKRCQELGIKIGTILV